MEQTKRLPSSFCGVSFTWSFRAEFTSPNEVSFTIFYYMEMFLTPGKCTFDLKRCFLSNVYNFQLVKDLFL